MHTNGRRRAGGLVPGARCALSFVLACALVTTTSFPMVTPAFAEEGAAGDQETPETGLVVGTAPEELDQGETTEHAPEGEDSGEDGGAVESGDDAAQDDQAAAAQGDAEERDASDQDATAGQTVAVAPAAPASEQDEQEGTDERAAADETEPSTSGTRVLAVAEDAPSAGPNLARAQKRFPAATQVVSVSNVEELEAALKQADTTAGPIIVYAASGEYLLTSPLSVPKNVILVGEADTRFVAAFSSLAQQMVKLWGSLYGGVYDGQGRTKGTAYTGGGKTNQGIRIQEVAFTGVNGVIECVTVKGVTRHGILADGRGTRNIQIVGCTVTDCGWNGINIHDEPQVTIIKNCTISNNGYDAPEGCSGINMRHSTIGRIENCVIQNNADKGVSTNADADSSIKVPGCAIGTICNCNISYNRTNGVYLKPLCRIDHFFNNTMRGNPDGIACVAKYQGATGNSYIKDVRNNVFDGNANSQVYVRQKGAVVEIGAGNTMRGGKNAVVVLDGAVLKVYGNGNVIEQSKGAGIDVNGGTATISGSNTRIQNNATHGFYVNKGTVTIKGSNTLVSGNKQVGIGMFAKGKVTITGSSTTIQKSGTNNVFVGGGSKLKISGKKTSIKGAGNIGISMSGKSSADITGAGASVASSKKFGIYVTGGSKLVISGASCKVESNGNNGIHLQGGKATIKGAKASISKNKGSGITASEKSTLTITGKSCSIKKNKKFGVYAAGKSKATLKKVKLSGNKLGGTYKESGGKITKK